MDEKFSYWNFIEKNHPRFSSDDRILFADIIFRYLDGDEVCDDDMDELNRVGTKYDLLQALVYLETSLFSEALGSFYKELLCLDEQVGAVLPSSRQNPREKQML